MSKKILSGMRPTGKLHIGHMVGVLDNWVKLQSEYDSYFFVADWHAITTQTNTDNIKEDSFEMANDWIASGIEPEKSTLFIQSLVPEHTELHLIFSMLNNLPRLERVPSYKGQLEHLLSINKKLDLSKGIENLDEKEIENAKSKISYGFLGYPVLQSADILIHKSEVIPVGEDQLPHIELTREIARKFNNLYGNIFPEPEAILTQTPRVLGTDGRKMSKSYHNVICPTDSRKEIWEGVKKMVTDPSRIRRDDPGQDPFSCSVYQLHLAYNSENMQTQIMKDCRSASIGCFECKGELANKIHQRYEGYSDKRNELDSQKGLTREILVEGSKKARVNAAETLKEVKEKMKFNY